MMSVKTSVIASARWCRAFSKGSSFTTEFFSVLVVFALWGKIPLPVGVVGHEGSTVIVVMNSLRLLFSGTTKKAA